MVWNIQNTIDTQGKGNVIDHLSALIMLQYVRQIDTYPAMHLGNKHIQAPVSAKQPSGGVVLHDAQNLCKLVEQNSTEYFDIRVGREVGESMQVIESPPESVRDVLYDTLMSKVKDGTMAITHEGRAYIISVTKNPLTRELTLQRE